MTSALWTEDEEEALEGGCRGGVECMGEECVCGEIYRKVLAHSLRVAKAKIAALRKEICMWPSANCYACNMAAKEN